MIVWNTLKTTLLLAALTGLLIVVGSALGGATGMIIACVLAAALNLGARWYSDKIALKFSGAREVDEYAQPELHRVVEALSANAGIPKPRVYVMDTPQPNAFATGRDPQHAAVAVTTGLMQTLNRADRDTLISSIVATLAGVITLLADMAQWALIFGGLCGNSDEDEGGSLAGSLVMIIVAPIAALLIQLAISRSREFSADEGGARILGDPHPLADALEKIERAAQHQLPAQVRPATSHLYIINPLRGGLAGLFRTLPPSVERVARRRAMTLVDLALA